MFIRIRNLLSGLIIGIALASCGGGGGGQVAEGGIGGTGISTGTVTGFGSVYVNGVKYETASTTYTGDDNETADQNGLAKGMVVTVKGSINNDGVTGTATSINFEDLMEGPISVKGADTLTIMDHTVHVNANTQYQGTDFVTLDVGHVVEVSGYYNQDYNIIATYIKFTGDTNHEVTGEVTATSPQVTLNGVMTVNGIASVSVGDYIEVFGTYGSGVFTASGFESRTRGFDVNDRDEAELEGVSLNTCLALPCIISINGQDVKIDVNTQFDAGSYLDIAVGSLLEVEGSLINGVLVADELEFETTAELEAEVASVGTDVGGTKILTITDTGTLSGFEVEISNTNTQFDAGSYDNPTSEGAHLRFLGMMNGSRLIATRVELGSAPDIQMEGAVESFVDGSSITVMGLTISTAGLSFTLDDGTDLGQPLTSAQFYAHLANNVAKVEVKGELISGTVVWSEVELDL